MSAPLTLTTTPPDAARFAARVVVPRDVAMQGRLAPHGTYFAAITTAVLDALAADEVALLAKHLTEQGEVRVGTLTFNPVLDVWPPTEAWLTRALSESLVDVSVARKAHDEVSAWATQQTLVKFVLPPEKDVPEEVLVQIGRFFLARFSAHPGLVLRAGSAERRAASWEPRPNPRPEALAQLAEVQDALALWTMQKPQGFTVGLTDELAAVHRMQPHRRSPWRSAILIDLQSAAATERTIVLFTEPMPPREPHHVQE